MTAIQQITAAQLGRLIRAAEEQCADTPHLEWQHIVELCAVAVAAAAAGVGGHRGQTARSAALLLLECDCDWLTEDARRELADVCEQVADARPTAR